MGAGGQEGGGERAGRGGRGHARGSAGITADPEGRLALSNVSGVAMHVAMWAEGVFRQGTGPVGEGDGDELVRILAVPAGSALPFDRLLSLHVDAEALGRDGGGG